MSPPATSGKARGPPRQSCKECPACLADPCGNCWNCTSPKSKKKCKQNICQNLLRSASPPPAPASTPASSPPASTSTGVANQAGPSSNPTPGTSSLSNTEVGAMIERLLLPSTTLSPSQSSSTTSDPTMKSVSANEDGSAPKRQKLQEEHLHMKWVFENWVEVSTDDSTAGGSSYQCKKCPRSFQLRIEAVRHASTCGTPSKAKKRGKNKRMLTCNLCPFQASTRAKLSKHRMSEHKDLLRQSNCCTTCQKTFKTVKNLKMHIRMVHMKLKNFKCNICPLKFPTKFSRNRHLLTHQGDEAAERVRLDEEQAFLRAIERSESFRSLQGQDVDVDGLQESTDDHDPVLSEEGEVINEPGGSEDGMDVGDPPVELSLAVTQRNEAINEKTEKYLEICREWGDTEDMIAKKRKMMLATLITTESFYVPRTKPPSAAPRLPSTSSAANSLLGNSSSLTPGEQEVVPTGGCDQV